MGASLLILAPVLLLFAAEDPPSFFASYSWDFKSRFLPAYLVVLIFSYLFERARERSQSELAPPVPVPVQVMRSASHRTNRSTAPELSGRRR